MAGLGQEAVVPIRPDLATNLQPLRLDVQQNAVALVADSFRQGQISADDIISRYGALAKGKEKMAIQGIDEYLNPDAIATRQNQQAALNTEAILKSSPEYIAAKESEMAAVKINADQGDNAAIRKFAIESGFGGKLSPFASIDTQQDLQAYKSALRYKSAVTAAKNVGADVNRVPSSIKSTRVVDGKVISSTVEDPSKDLLASKTSAVNYTPEQTARAKVLSNMTAEEHEAEGSPTFGQYVFGIEPTVTSRPGAATAAKPVVPVTDLVTPPTTTETETRKPDGTTIYQKKVVGSVQHPAPPAATADARSPFETSYEEKPVTEDPGKKFTDVQGRALFALSGANSAERTYTDLEKKGYNLTGWAATLWDIANKLPVPEELANQFKSGERQQFERAIVSFDEGFLRLLSGAAISSGEHKTYRRMFWPVPGDSATIVEEKKQLRAQAATSAAQMLESGGAFAAGSQGQKSVQETFDRALAIEKSYGSAATPTQGAAVTVLDSGEEIIDRGGGGIMVRKPTTSTNAAPAVTPKYTTPGLKKVVF